MAGIIDFSGFLKPISDTINKGLDLIPDPNKRAEITKELELKYFDVQTSIESELTKRQNSDMLSDSWLSKNVRPLALIVLSLWYAIVFIISYFGFSAGESMMDILKTLIITVFQFYFGGRTIEKAASMVSAAIRK
jgi:hypothetical protein